MKMRILQISILKTDALQDAEQNGHLAVVRYLVEEHHTNVNYGNDYALRMAAINGHFPVVKYLVENGAIVDDWVLRWAKLGGHTAILNYLRSRMN